MCGSEFGTVLWHHLTPQRKQQYRCRTTIPHVHKSPKDVLENLLPVWLLVRTNLFIPSHFWTTCTNFDNCCQHYIYRHLENNLYRCTSTFSALDYCGGIFFKSLSYLYKVGAETFPSIFGLFTIFDHNFAKIVAPPSDGNKNCLALLKGQSLLKKEWKQNQNRSIYSNTIAIQSISHSSEWPAGLLSVTKKKN